jgi:hypothetical protein
MSAGNDVRERSIERNGVVIDPGRSKHTASRRARSLADKPARNRDIEQQIIGNVAHRHGGGSKFAAAFA